MQSIKTALVLMLVAVWALASNHCRLEWLPGLAFLVCNDQADCTGQQDKDCETDSCATVENQLYKVENAQALIPAPPLLLADFLSPVFDAALALPARVPTDAALAILPRFWQFSYRTALPPRAPSLLS